MNRVTAMIAKVEEQIKARIESGALTPERIEQQVRTLDMAFDEYCSFQSLKSLAFAQGILTDDEAQTVYGLLGSIPDDFNKQSYATKFVLSKLYNELLGMRIKAIRGH